MSISVYIWPDLWGDYQYGVFFYDEKEEIFEQIYVDKDINYIPNNPDNDEFNKYIQELITDNYEEIKSMIASASDL